MFKHYICHVRIEEEIKQKRAFGSVFEKAMVNLVFTSNWLVSIQNDFFTQYGLTIKQYNILRILRGAGKPISTADIRSRMLDKMSDTSRIVDRMDKKGLVEKNSCKTDHRKVDVRLTKQSLLLLEQIDNNLHKWQESMINLNPKEAEQLSSLLDKLRNK